MVLIIHRERVIFHDTRYVQPRVAKPAGSLLFVALFLLFYKKKGDSTRISVSNPNSIRKTSILKSCLPVDLWTELTDQHHVVLISGWLEETLRNQM